MDPNEALRLIRAYIKQMRVERTHVAVAPGTTTSNFIQHADDLAETIEGLDEWLSRDGFVPDDWRSDDEKAGVRNLARFTTMDAETVLGRPLTQSEERRLVKTLEHSSMGEVFTECVDICTDQGDPTEAEKRPGKFPDDYKEYPRD